MNESAYLLSELSPSAGQRRAATVVAATLVITFLALLLIKDRQLPVISAYIPIVDSLLFLNDLITAALLYAQYSLGHHRRGLALAAGYLFTALIVVPHILAFPGAFSATGLLGANPGISVWFYFFARLGLATAVIVYSLEGAPGSSAAGHSAAVAKNIFWSIAAVVMLVCALVLLVTRDWFVPSTMRDPVRATWVWTFTLAPTLLFANAAAILMLWRRSSSILDMWLLVALCAWYIELVLVTLSTSRFTVYWYAGIYGVVASCFVLMILLYDSTVLYARLALTSEERNKAGERQRLTLQVVASSMAHELQQPLAASLLNVEVARARLAESPPNLPRLRAVLDDIEADGFRANEIITSIRATLMGSAPAMAPLSIRELVAETLTILRFELRAHEVSVQLDVAADLPPVSGNKSQLVQVMVNLVTNAIEAMLEVTDRSRVLSIHAAARESAMLSVAIEDSGPGIPTEHAGRLFEPFFTTKSSGTGLGLAICLDIVEAHGGRISASRRPVHGSIFQILLPTA